MTPTNDQSPYECCGAFGGCTLPKGHNMGRADIRENHDFGDHALSAEAVNWLSRQDPELAERLQAIADGTCHDGHQEGPNPSTQDHRLELSGKMLDRMKELRDIARGLEARDLEARLSDEEAAEVNRLTFEITAIEKEIRSLDNRSSSAHVHGIPMNIEISELFDIARDLAQTTPFVHEKGFPADRWNITCLLCRRTAVGVGPYAMEEVPHLPTCTLERSRRVTGRSVTTKGVPGRFDPKHPAVSDLEADCRDTGCSWRASGELAQIRSRAALHTAGTRHEVRLPESPKPSTEEQWQNPNSEG